MKFIKYILLCFLLIFNCKNFAKVKVNMIAITNQESLVMKVNEKFSYSKGKHESVGFTNEYLISDESVVKCIDRKVEYQHPERLKMHMSGADAATETFIFQTLKQGQSLIVFKHLFRGKLDEEKKISITVE
jgi:hypothetical protein